MGAIVMNDITKRVGRKRVLDQVNLEVLEGEFYSILSLEEEAKDALVKILLNFKKPSNGYASIYDFDVNKQSKEVKGYTTLISKEALFPEGDRRKTIFKRTLNFHDLEAPEDYEDLLDLFDCQENLKVINMDLRQRRLTSIVNALIAKPKVLIVQDATKYINPTDIQKFLNKLKTLQKQENLTILFLSDDLSIAQRYSDRVAYLYEGKIRDIEYLKEKQTKDKLLKIYSPRVNKNEFFDLGARPILSDDGVETFYYDGYLPKLTEVLSRQEIEDYNIEDALLEDKLDAYYGSSAEMPQREKDLYVSSATEKTYERDEDQGLKQVTAEEVMDESAFQPVKEDDLNKQEKFEVHEEKDQEEISKTFNPSTPVDQESVEGDTKVLNKDDLLNQLEKGNDKGGFNQ